MMLARDFDHFAKLDFCTAPRTRFWIFAVDWNLGEDLAGTDEYSEEVVRVSYELAEVGIVVHWPLAFAAASNSWIDPHRRYPIGLTWIHHSCSSRFAWVRWFESDTGAYSEWSAPPLWHANQRFSRQYSAYPLATCQIPEFSPCYWHSAWCCSQLTMKEELSYASYASQKALFSSGLEKRSRSAAHLGSSGPEQCSECPALNALDFGVCDPVIWWNQAEGFRNCSSC